MAVFPNRHDPTKIDSVSYFEFAKATHRVAHLARPGRKGKDGEVAAVLLHCDTIVYITAILGMMRAGFIVCFRHINADFALTTMNAALPHVAAQHS